MKGKNLFRLVLSITFMMLAACSEQSDEPFLKGTPIGLTSKIIQASRVSTQHLQSTQIAEERQIGVTILGAQNEHQNVVWLAGRNGALSNIGDEVLWGTDQVTVTAYHPYHAEWGKKDVTFSVQTDQTTDEGYLDSDLLWSKTTAAPAAHPVTLPFTHKLAKINISLTSEDYTNMSNALVSVCGVRIAAGFNTETGELSEATGSVADVKAGITTNESKTVTALLIPQMVKTGIPLIKISFDGKEFHYTLTETMEYKGGHSYNYTLKVTDKSLSVVEVGSGSIDDMDNKEW